MADTFLCPRHAQWLLENPENIESVWSRGMETAQAFLQENELGSALAHFGCAYEAVTILTHQSEHCSAIWQRREYSSYSLLQMVAAKLGVKLNLGSVH